MTTPLESLIATGTKLWLDSIDPELVASNRKLGATGATSNPVIVGQILQTGRFDDGIAELMASGLDDDSVAWQMTDRLVSEAQKVFQPVWNESNGNDGYVSFELDPLIEDPEANLAHEERVRQYIELGKRWSEGHSNRMIKVPATPAGIDALEELAAAGITLNVTLVFTMRQYEAARDAIWRGAQRRSDLSTFKSVYSIFVSRVDVYTAKSLPQLSAELQGNVGILNAKQIWQANQEFWTQHPTPLQQEIVFASTGTKGEGDPPWKYVAALAGSDIQTNPPKTNDLVQESGLSFENQVSVLPEGLLPERKKSVDDSVLEATLMLEGIEKFVVPQNQLLGVLASKRSQLLESKSN